eukprot:TRINITY_DN19331_c0_g1_i1.p2 TRINITY_DN19331_c0_g1~~TRINITY_DN19331_c0_g1_i1.p2  ORF type:complete len:160 (-),score=20.74 TRINITY_DN19331_c0_g1_i1:632-1111(-)
MIFFFLMIRRPPRSTLSSSSAASDVYKRQPQTRSTALVHQVAVHHRRQSQRCIRKKRTQQRNPKDVPYAGSPLMLRTRQKNALSGWSHALTNVDSISSRPRCSRRTSYTADKDRFAVSWAAVPAPSSRRIRRCMPYVTAMSGWSHVRSDAKLTGYSHGN